MTKKEILCHVWNTQIVGKIDKQVGDEVIWFQNGIHVWGQIQLLYWRSRNDVSNHTEARAKDIHD